MAHPNEVVFVHFFSGQDLKYQCKKNIAVDKGLDPETNEVVRLKAEMVPLKLRSMTQTNKDPNFGQPEVTYGKLITYYMLIMHFC